MPPHGRMSGMSIIEASLALATGQANYVALLYANIGRSRRVFYGGDEIGGVWDPYGFTSPGAAHAMMFRRHMELYGTTTRQLAEVSVAFRYHAALNPDAVMRKPITIDEHEESRPIVVPLRLLDYCLINDGAVCMIMTTPERAKDLRQAARARQRLRRTRRLSPIRRSRISTSTFGTTRFASRRTTPSGWRASPATMSTRSWLRQFQPDGSVQPRRSWLLSTRRGWRVRRGRNASSVGGALPTNTDGGHLSNSYMQGWALNVEAVRQLRGECGARQVPDCEVVAYVQATPCTRVIVYTRGLRRSCTATDRRSGRMCTGSRCRR